jgi:hypothetical protein
LVKIVKFLVIATLMIAPMVAASAKAFAASSPAADSSPALPQNWDSNIPLPPGAVLMTSSVPKSGVVYAADFSVPGDYKELVDFYEKELPKAGFAMGPKVAAPARKVYNRNFNKGDMMDSVVISPIAQDRSRFSVHFAWTPEAAKPASKAP